MNPEDEVPVREENDILIIMHREAHFAGQFDLMLNHYVKEERGVQPEIAIARIQELAMLEKELNQNLAPIFLQGSDAEKLARSRQLYKNLRGLYENNKPETRIARLVADLILTEDAEAEKEIEAIVKEKGAAVPALIQLIQTEDLYDPLFPGFGESPKLAIKALGKIGDKRSIITIFESIGKGDFFDDDLALNALQAIGAPAKTFLLRVLAGKPINEDNEKAAIALLSFKNDPEIAATALKLLQQPEIREDPALPTYLALSCSGLAAEQERSAFKALLTDPTISKTLRLDMQSVIKEWQG